MITLLKEVSIFINVYHTHQGGNELANGTNCPVAGDLLCDTPADSSLSSNVEDDGCIGIDTDANGQSYGPSTVNIPYIQDFETGA